MLVATGIETRETATPVAAAHVEAPQFVGTAVIGTVAAVVGTK